MKTIMRKITGKTIAKAIEDGDIKVGTVLQVDRDVTCQWHMTSKVEEISQKLQEDGIYEVKHRVLDTDKLDVCSCTIAQKADGLTITIFDEPTTMKKITSMLKRILDKDAQTLYKAGYLNGDMELTEDGKNALQTILFSEKKSEMVKLAEEELAESKES